MVLKKFQISLGVDQRKYGQAMIQKCIQYIIKEYLLLLKDIQDLEELNLQIYDFNIKNVYIDKLNNIVDNKHQETIKMTPIDTKTSKYIDFVVESNDKDPKFKIGYHVIISKQKKYFYKSLDTKLVRKSFCY